MAIISSIEWFWEKPMVLETQTIETKSILPEEWSVNIWVCPNE